MICLSEFNLITPDDDTELYNTQCKILNELNCNYSESLLQVAILQTLSPVCDYYESIKILKACYNDITDIRFAIIGAYLSSEWESNKPNVFLEILNENIPTANELNKAIIYYLKAYDIFKRNQEQENIDRCTFLLNKSILHQHENPFFYNHYYLAKISEKDMAKMLLKKSLPCIRPISEEECLKLTPSDFVSYDSFVNEHILGVSMSAENFAAIQAYFHTL